MSAPKTYSPTTRTAPFTAVATVPGDFLAPALYEAIQGTAWLFRKVASIIRRD